MLALIFLVGCACPTVLGVTPGDGTGPYARDTVIRVALDGNGDVTFTVDGPDGAIAGAVTYGEAEAVFTPSELLPEGSQIEYRVEACDSAAYGAFEVGSIDHAVPPEDLDGNTYALDLADATWVSPSSGGALIEQYFSGSVLVGIEAVSDTELDALGASGQATTNGSWQQDPCFETIDFEPVAFTGNPYFEIFADAVEFTVQGAPVQIQNVRISGGLTADEVVDGRFSGEVDFREVDIVQDGCAMIGMLGLECSECTSDGEVQCLFIEAEDVAGEVVPGLVVVPNEDPEECE